jgi:rare lipoprotein A
MNTSLRKCLTKAAILFLLSCLCIQILQAQQKVDSISLGGSKKVAAVQTGIASFYHDKFEGRKTANGSIFTQSKMTAASNKYPLNSWVKVINLSNKREVYVKITDRMHPKNTRLIDLTTTAARQLRFMTRGLVKVRVEYMGKKEPLLSEKKEDQQK